MKKSFLCLGLLITAASLHAQIQVLKMVGNRANEFSIGYGASLKFSVPASDADYVSFEGGVNIFFLKEDAEYGIMTVPVKVGYRYTLDRSGTGFYVEPQLGYNVFGLEPVYNGYTYDEPKNTGPVGAVNVGYLFQPWKKVQFDLGAFYETILHSGTTTSYVGLRLSHSFAFGRRERD